MATELEELLDFLSSPSPPVKKAAVDSVRGLTGLEDSLQSLSNDSKIALPSLSRLLSENKIGDAQLQGLYVMKLVRSFCRSSSEISDGSFEHVGSIPVNISKKEEGRKILLDSKRGLLKQIVRQFDSSGSLQKKGVFSSLQETLLLGIVLNTNLERMLQLFQCYIGVPTRKECCSYFSATLVFLRRY